MGGWVVPASWWSAANRSQRPMAIALGDQKKWEADMNAKEVVTSLFAKWEAGDSSGFFASVADEVVWTAIGSTRISGVSHTKKEYLEKTYLPLQAIFAGPTSC